MQLVFSRRTRPGWLRAVAGGLLTLQVAGCYQYVPAASSTFPAGTDVSLSITDEGRVALAERIGEGLRRVNGQLLGTTDTTFVLAAYSFEFLDVNLPVRANGKRLDIARKYVTDLRVKQLSKKRTWVAAGFAVLGAAIASTIAITGFGADPGSTKPGGDGTQGQ